LVNNADTDADDSQVRPCGHPYLLAGERIPPLPEMLSVGIAFMDSCHYP